MSPNQHITTAIHIPSLSNWVVTENCNCNSGFKMLWRELLKDVKQYSLECIWRPNPLILTSNSRIADSANHLMAILTGV